MNQPQQPQQPQQQRMMPQQPPQQQQQQQQNQHQQGVHQQQQQAQAQHAADASKNESFDEQQVRDRANMILDNNQLLMRYALANDLSVPRARMYFEKVAAGFEPQPEIENWFPLS